MVITKPTGLALNELLIAHIGWDGGPADTVTPPAGWTTVRSDVGHDACSYILRKVADSSDVAATNFTFTLNNTRKVAGAMFRVNGQSIGTPVYTSAMGYEDNNNTTPITFDDGGASPSVTPLTASSLFIMFVTSKGSNSNIAYSGYAIVTSSPTWTEAYDMTDAQGVNQSTAMAAAYGVRTQITATGGMSVVVANNTSTTDFTGQIIIIPPSKDFSILDTVTATDNIRLNLSILIRDSVTLLDNLVASTDTVWRTLAKNVSSWINDDKS